MNKKAALATAALVLALCALTAFMLLTPVLEHNGAYETTRSIGAWTFRSLLIVVIVGMWIARRREAAERHRDAADYQPYRDVR